MLLDISSELEIISRPARAVYLYEVHLKSFIQQETLNIYLLLIFKRCGGVILKKIYTPVSSLITQYLKK